MSRPTPVKEWRLVEGGLEEWRAVAASARGSQHDRRGLPNQDAFAVRAVPGRAGALVVAVADGHGGDRYVRSDAGARFAVDIACAETTARLVDGARLEDVVDRALPAAVVRRWREQVEQDVAARPFTDAERQRARATLDGPREIPYGATLLVAVATADGLALLQLGDGDIVVATPAGVLTPVPGDARLVAGMTTSLCLPTAVDDVRRAVIPAEVGADLVLVATDGYGNSFASPEWRGVVMADLRRAIVGEGLGVVEQSLPAWAQESATMAGDDVTVAVLSRLSAVLQRPASP